MSAGVDDFLQYVAPYAPDCPTIMIESFIRQSMVEFFQETGVWSEWIEITTTAGVAANTLSSASTPPGQIYSIPCVVNSQGNKLSKGFGRPLSTSGVPSAYKQTAIDEITFFPTPDNAYTFQTFVFLFPDASTYLIPNTIFIKYQQVISDGVVAKLLRMPRKVWSNRESAIDFEMDFKNGQTAAKIDANSAVQRVST